jgi:hypothetical protein
MDFLITTPQAEWFSRIAIQSAFSSQQSAISRSKNLSIWLMAID